MLWGSEYFPHRNVLSMLAARRDRLDADLIGAVVEMLLDAVEDRLPNPTQSGAWERTAIRLCSPDTRKSGQSISSSSRRPLRTTSLVGTCNQSVINTLRPRTLSNLC
jgi:hypothetical protein